MKSVRYQAPLSMMGRTGRRARRSTVKKYRNGWIELMFWVATTAVLIGAALLVTKL